MLGRLMKGKRVILIKINPWRGKKDKNFLWHAFIVLTCPPNTGNPHNTRAFWLPNFNHWGYEWDGRKKKSSLSDFNSLIANNTSISSNNSDSMDRRCDAVIAANGGVTRY